MATWLLTRLQACFAKMSSYILYIHGLDVIKAF